MGNQNQRRANDRRGTIKMDRDREESKKLILPHRILNLDLQAYVPPIEPSLSVISVVLVGDP